MKKINIAFFGAPNFAAHLLQQIIEDANLPVSVTFVVTQPDRPSGRKQILTPTPVKLMAQKHNIPVFDNSQLSTLNLQLKNIDLVLLYAYGELIPPEILKMPRWGFWNIHPSLLPSYRGPSPIAYPLLLGDAKTGTSLIQMDELLDHGPIIDKEQYAIQQTDTQETLRERLSSIGYKLFKKNVQLLLDGAVRKNEQIHSQATFTRLLTKKDGFIPFPVVQKIYKGEGFTKDNLPLIIQEYCDKYHLLATRLPSLRSGISGQANHYSRAIYYSLFRALSPWPGIWTILPGEKRLKITGMELQEGIPTLTKVQLEGKKETDVSIFQTAYGVF